MQDFIAHVHLVQRVQYPHSVIYNMKIKELKEQMEGGELNQLLYQLLCKQDKARITE